MFILFISGFAADNMSRKFLMFTACILWSLTTVGTAFAHTFGFVCLMRMLLGMLEAFFAPPCYSLITDYFPPSKRTTANSVISFGIYVGSALSSLTIFLISAQGWRWTYCLLGALGVSVGLIGLLVVKEPARGRFEPPKVAKPEF